jgi:hypothetical protein
MIVGDAENEPVLTVHQAHIYLQAETPRAAL